MAKPKVARAKNGNDARNIIQKPGPYTFEDIHNAIFAEPPEPSTLEELKESIGRYIRKKHARR